jgi:hypothetical protein
MGSAAPQSRSEPDGKGAVRWEKPLSGESPRRRAERARCYDVRGDER